VTARPSRRLRVLVALLRRTAKPALRRIAGPAEARRAFERAARWGFRRPPHVFHRAEPGMPPLHWISCGPCRSRGAILYFHGGGYVAGSPATHAGLVGRLSHLSGLRAAVPDYRLAPEHAAPAAFEDARAAHAALLARGFRPQDVVLAGDSAGGGLALALLAELSARGQPPRAVLAFSPWTDLALGSASLADNARADPLLPVARVEELVGLVAGELARDDPRLSPLHARFVHPAPTLIQVGSTEILRDDAVRMAARLRQAGARVRLEIWPDAPHAWPLFDGWVPEAREALHAASGFLAETALPAGAPQAPGP